MLVEEGAPKEAGMVLYHDFISYNRGYFYFSVVILFSLLWMAANAASGLWLAVWSEANTLHNTSHLMNYYLGIFIATGVGYGFFAFIRALLIAYSVPNMSTRIHESMVSSLLFAPIN